MGKAKERILQAALRLFAQRGFQGVSVRDIAPSRRQQWRDKPDNVSPCRHFAIPYGKAFWEGRRGAGDFFFAPQKSE